MNRYFSLARVCGVNNKRLTNNIWARQKKTTKYRKPHRRTPKEYFYCISQGESFTIIKKSIGLLCFTESTEQIMP